MVFRTGDGGVLWNLTGLTGFWVSAEALTQH